MSTGSGSFFTTLKSTSDASKMLVVGTSTYRAAAEYDAASAIAPHAAPVTPFTNALTDEFSAYRR